MKKVLVVDDEKLVRRGIITTFPWEKYGFTVVAEAGNGEKALEFIEMHKVDLLLTDLGMPGMSGLELIKQVRLLHPEMYVAVLTCHDNFKYIQDTMRMGVLDYIIKTEIEDKIIEEVLARISEKMCLGSPGVSVPTPDISMQCVSSTGILICGKHRSCNLIKLLNLGINWISWHNLVEIDKLTWFLPVQDSKNGNLMLKELLFTTKPEEWVLAGLTNIHGEDRQEILRNLQYYRRRILFYDYLPIKRNYEFALDRIAYVDNEDQHSTTQENLFSKWNELGWVYSDNIFEDLLSQTKNLHTETTKLWSILNNVVLNWDRLLSMQALRSLMDSVDDFLFWQDWRLWIQEFRMEIKKKVQGNSSNNISQNIMKAIEYMNVTTSFDLDELEIAKKVNMSRGYFSRCFKRVTGKFFGEYYRDLKLEKAKAMILQTDEPIIVIAEKCGFDDYRYFGRIFRQSTGMLPKVYRKVGAK